MSVVLGIDPGTGRIGYGVLCVDAGSPARFVDCGLIRVDSPDRPARLEAIHLEVQKLFEKYRPDLLALERLFFNKNIKTALAVSEAVGVILLAARLRRIPVREYTPLEVKEVAVGSGKAKKQEVKGMLEALFGLKIKGPDDVADALAVAYCHVSLEALGL